METHEKWLVANWKMHGSRATARDFAYHVNAALANRSGNVRVVFCPPTLYLDAAREALPQNAQLALGAQDCHTEASGAFTGDCSALMLAGSGAQFVIVGHSERRAGYGESDATVAKKAAAAQAAGLTPIICIGEQWAEYEAGKTADILTQQIAPLKALYGRYIIAYEPVWAIGSGKIPSMKDIAAAHAVIKSLLGSGVAVLYGGSVKPDNVQEILSQPLVDGVLIGGASLKAESMIAMMASAG